MGVIQMVKPKAIFMDLAGTAIKTQFIDKNLKEYITHNIKKFVAIRWKDKNVRKCVDSLRREANNDQKAPKISPPEAPEGPLMISVIDYVNYCSENKIDNNAIIKFRFHMWFDGYDKNKLRTEVYTDVGKQLRIWKNMEIKLYVVSNTWVEGTKKMLSKTTQGDLNSLMDGHFDSTIGPLNQKETYEKIAEKIEIEEEKAILFLTNSPAKAKAAKEAKIMTILVLTHHKNVKKLTDEEKKLPRIRSFNELQLSLYELSRE